MLYTSMLIIENIHSILNICWYHVFITI